MGLDVNGTRALLYAKKRGVDYSQAATIGRQNLNLTPAELRRNLAEFGDPAAPEAARSIFAGGERYPFAEPFLRYLGAATADSFDASHYENATHVHDMNQPVPEALHGQYSVVIDGGSLEHVFNFPVALANCLDMVRVGGHFVAVTVANNYPGHGFYQFSPELYFSTLTPANGFELLDVVVFTAKSRRWYAVANPESVRGRVILTSRAPVDMLVIARKVASLPLFTASPQQSDYVRAWTVPGTTPAVRHPVGSILNRLPPAIKWPLWRWTLPFTTGFRRRFFTRMNPAK